LCCYGLSYSLSLLVWHLDDHHEALPRLSEWRSRKLCGSIHL
jgi:hypothetical protein